ncbi:cytochrome c oxidase subunit 6b-1-like isoform X1 [Populus nigra]|uniref:cytochrome c oxidase subunit 6b-1-like isoform X1 n=1 Tax=Populus nigra TaxID=3691 RepID=UPI002B26B129|nr:cytochrome c oxidase subunit 6b-1-like isoform X1 [Populus nigra]
MATETPTLSERYELKGKEEKTDVVSKPVEVKEEEKPATAVSEEAAEKAEEAPPLAAEEKTEDTPAAAEESTEAPTTDESSSEDAPAAAEETNEGTEENSGEEAVEEKKEIKLETAPADYRFPTTNQTRHCFTRYIEYHRCVAAKGEGASECDKFAKYYRSLCPSEWVRISEIFNILRSMILVFTFNHTGCSKAV